MPRCIHHHYVLGLERCDGFDFDMIVFESAVRTLRVGLVQLDAVGDGTEQLTDVAIHGQMQARLQMVALSE